MKIAFRTDSSLLIGTGHLMRCLSLADILRSRGAQTIFLCRHILDYHANLLQQKKYAVAKLPGHQLSYSDDGLAHSQWLGTSQLQDASDSRNALSGAFWDWLVVDHYALDARWESAMLQSAARILVIDDLADRLHNCDILLDQNLHFGMEKRYVGKVSKHCRLLLGPDYALLRDEFLKRRASVQARTGPVNQVLVFMGGVDKENITSRVIRALEVLNRPKIRVAVVIGANHPARDGIETACRQKGYQCYIETTHMAELMAQSDLAIGSAGSAAWERCCMGLPTICVTIAKNQMPIAEALALRGAVINLGDSDQLSEPELLKTLIAMIQNRNKLISVSCRCLSLVDGCGAKRVAEMMWSAV